MTWLGPRPTESGAAAADPSLPTSTRWPADRLAVAARASSRPAPPGSRHGGCAVDLPDDIDGIVSREVEKKIELRRQYRGRDVVLNGYDVQLPVVESDDVSDGQL